MAASRRLIDHWRSDRSRRDRELAAAAREAPGAEVADRDDSLMLLFLCCHESLAPSSAIPLTLRAVGGLTTREIARAFLVPESTMAQRVSRAKQRIRAAGATFELPTDDALTGRLASVLHVLYLMFNEGYAASSGEELTRTDLGAEAIRLARLVRSSFPAEAEAIGLLALMLLLEARRAARIDAGGDLVPLAGQDRSRWDAALIAEGTALLRSITDAGLSPGEYCVQAEIAAVHDHAVTAADTDWPRIVDLYGVLEELTGNPVVTVNRAVATAMASGPQAGLDILAEVDPRVVGEFRVAVVRAHLCERLGDRATAIESFRTAHGLATNVREQRFLATQISRLEAGQMLSG